MNHQKEVHYIDNHCIYIENYIICSKFLSRYHFVHDVRVTLSRICAAHGTQTIKFFFLKAFFFGGPATVLKKLLIGQIPISSFAYIVCMLRAVNVAFTLLIFILTLNIRLLCLHFVTYMTNKFIFSSSFIR
jgi:hypothetical protein